ncbi:transmembrane protein 200C-like [Leucoraja erinacea]|uniref:transmembrane protein 200C-like n=1 Tax=Leucoraja erinaceus TaxID=7782 RepID=UPI002454E87C|nr:transmembrane protein 200C-like [Leucoraja erinacea]
MIATGGILRITARTNNSLQSCRRTNKYRRKVSKTTKNNVVILKAKLKLCSIPGLITAFGILVMLGGIAMVIMGYWPRAYKISKTISQNATSNNMTAETKTLEIISGFLAQSDKLKIFGPMVVGIGIFLFICANAVLHESRDKKTKIINMQDIYSTVIDIQSKGKKAYVPNGVVNYVQCKSMYNLKPPDSHNTVKLAESSCQSPTADDIKTV